MSGMAVEVTGSPDPFEQPPQEVPTRQGDPDEGQPYSQVLPQCSVNAEPRKHHNLGEDGQDVTDGDIGRGFDK